MGGIVVADEKRWMRAGIRLIRMPRLFNGVLALAERIRPESDHGSEIQPALELVTEWLSEHGHHELAGLLVQTADPHSETPARAGSEEASLAGVRAASDQLRSATVGAARLELGRIIRALEHLRDDLGRAERTRRS